MRLFRLPCMLALVGLVSLSGCTVIDDVKAIFSNKNDASLISKYPQINEEDIDRRAWMHDDIETAWKQGYKGQGAALHIVGDFSKNAPHQYGSLGHGSASLTNAAWASKIAGLTAPSALLLESDRSLVRRLPLELSAGKLNTVNLGAALMQEIEETSVDAVLSVLDEAEDYQAASIIRYAQAGEALVVKAAGDAPQVVGNENTQGERDLMLYGLIGAPSAIFVGALEDYGSPDYPAVSPPNTSRPGSDAQIQSQFLVVGVPAYVTNLYGTNYAAPTVSGYAAILGSKFTGATPTQIAQQLLTTARTDTIKNYDRRVHGMGEASLSRALAPSALY